MQVEIQRNFCNNVLIKNVTALGRDVVKNDNIKAIALKLFLKGKHEGHDDI